MNDELVDSLERIHVDARICGGRPHIRGTRVRVSDILDLLASGVPPSEILVDYPYLTEADLRAALAFGGGSQSAGDPLKDGNVSPPRQAA
jgi:uncharacterized protein (DUF433 family)